MAITIALGFWQWGRAAQKVALQVSIDERRSMPAIDSKALLGAKSLADIVHRPVLLRGTWLARYTVFLDNRQMQGHPGFYVVTPLQLEGSGIPVLVERGWVQRNFVDREKLPAIETPAGVVELRGRVAPPPAKLYEFAGAAQGAIRQNLDLAQFRAETGLALPSLAVQQTGDASQGLLRDWPQPGSGSERNYGYAFQWWAIAFVIAFLYAWFQFIVPRQRSRRQARHHA
ncbi:SURF1 family protein [Caenimonas koreensis DSM 17982]|uniref:SURF1-like protein n=1 Tax=Caenimonas koreensis DSM 17982 TaxID=1121255 RepID=A0A844B566_9BURK|nr:SURF1 family protein [Caenimonas koreensis DSM 17982]